MTMTCAHDCLMKEVKLALFRKSNHGQWSWLNDNEV